MDEKKVNTAPAVETQGRQERDDLFNEYDRTVIYGIKDKVLKLLEEMKREGKKTVTIRVVKETDPSKSALTDERWTRVLKRWQKLQEKRTAENRRME